MKDLPKAAGDDFSFPVLMIRRFILHSGICWTMLVTMLEATDDRLNAQQGYIAAVVDCEFYLLR